MSRQFKNHLWWVVDLTIVSRNSIKNQIKIFNILKLVVPKDTHNYIFSLGLSIVFPAQTVNDISTYGFIKIKKRIMKFDCLETMKILKRTSLWDQYGPLQKAMKILPNKSSTVRTECLNLLTGRGQFLSYYPTMLNISKNPTVDMHAEIFVIFIFNGRIRKFYLFKIISELLW